MNDDKVKHVPFMVTTPFACFFLPLTQKRLLLCETCDNEPTKDKRWLSNEINV